MITSREKKQYGIALIYLFFVGLFFFWFYSTFLKVAETCFDAVKNQNELKVDCGGVCGACEETIPVVDMEIKEASLVYGGSDLSDVVIQVYNPNDMYGASMFSYTLVLQDNNGQTIIEKTDTSFILPKETKYLIEVGLETQGRAQKVQVSIHDITWQTFSGYQEKPTLTLVNKRYGPVPSGVGFMQVSGTLVNESGFDFRTTSVNMVLRDENGKPLAVNKTELRTLTANERRDVGPLVFPAFFPGEVKSLEMTADADMYRSDNFIQRYLPNEKFQSL